MATPRVAATEGGVCAGCGFAGGATPIGMEVGIGKDGSEDGTGDGSTGTEGEGTGRDGNGGDGRGGTEGNGMGSGGTSKAEADVIEAKAKKAAAIKQPPGKILTDT